MRSFFPQEDRKMYSAFSHSWLKNKVWSAAARITKAAAWVQTKKSIMLEMKYH